MKFYNRPKKRKISYKTYIKTFEKKGIEIQDFQIILLKDLIKEINNGFVIKYKNWVEKLLKGDVRTSYKDQIIKIYEYNKELEKTGKKPSANTLEKMILFYGKEKGTKLFNEKMDNSKFKPGKDNIAYNHGGKFSPYSNKFIKYKNLDKNEIKQKRNDSINKASKNRKYNTKIEYYLEKGYSEKEAQKMLSQRQSTFSLDKCIQKYGDRGIEIWKERQQKWQKTLKAKSDTEIEIMNMKKSSGRGRITSKESYLYYIKFENTKDNDYFYKIGITSKSIEERFSPEKIFEINNNLRINVIHLHKGNTDFIYNLEQSILTENQDKRIRVTYNNFKSTECFNEDIWKEEYNEIIRSYQ